MDSDVSGITHNADRFASDGILRLLHWTAQPLSTIQGILEMTLTETMTAEEKQAWLEQAMEQIAQATSGFNQLRKIMETQSGWNAEERTMHV